MISELLEQIAMRGVGATRVSPVIPTGYDRSGNKAACREPRLRINAGDAGVAPTAG